MEETEEPNNMEILCPHPLCPNYGLEKVCFREQYPFCNILNRKAIHYTDGRYVPDFPLIEIEAKASRLEGISVSEEIAEPVAEPIA